MSRSHAGYRISERRNWKNTQIPNTTAYYYGNNNNNHQQFSSFSLTRSLSRAPSVSTHTHSDRDEAPTIPFIPSSRSRARQKTNRRCCRRKRRRRRHEEEGKQNYLRFILIRSLWTRGFYVSGKSRRAGCVWVWHELELETQHGYSWQWHDAQRVHLTTKTKRAHREMNCGT